MSCRRRACRHPVHLPTLTPSGLHAVTRSWRGAGPCRPSCARRRCVASSEIAGRWGRASPRDPRDWAPGRARPTPGPLLDHDPDTGPDLDPPIPRLRRAHRCPLPPWLARHSPDGCLQHRAPSHSTQGPPMQTKSLPIAPMHYGSPVAVPRQAWSETRQKQKGTRMQEAGERRRWPADRGPRSLREAAAGRSPADRGGPPPD